MTEERISQSKIEELKKIVLMDEMVNCLIRMMFYRVIQGSEGLTISVRAVKTVSDEESLHAIVQNIRNLIRKLNVEVEELDLPGRFRWMLGEYLFVIWYDVDGLTSIYDHVEKEVGNYTGNSSSLTVRFSDRLPEGTCELELDIYTGRGSAKILPFAEAMVTALGIRDLLPEIKVSLTNPPKELEDKLPGTIAYLFLTTVEKEALEEEEKQRATKKTRASKSE